MAYSFDYKSLTDLIELRSRCAETIDSSLISWLTDSVISMTFLFVEDGLDRSVGYCAWAAVNKESAARFVNFGHLPIYGHEWLEGDIALILDVAALPSWGRVVGRAARDRLMRDYVEVLYRRNNRPLRRFPRRSAPHSVYESTQKLTHQRN